MKESQYSIKIKYILLIHFQVGHIFGIPQSHVDQKTATIPTIKSRRRKILPTYTIPYTYATTKKFSPQSIRAIARNPNIDLQSIGIYSKSDIQDHIRTYQFQELLTQIDTIQRQSIDQKLRKLAETAGFSDIYTQDYSG